MPRLSPIPQMIENSTPEQEAKAMTLAEGTLRELRNILHRLDLPVTALETALRIFNAHLCGIVSEDYEAKLRERGKKIVEIHRLRGDGLGNVAYGGHGQISDCFPGLQRSAIGAGAGYYPVDLDQLSDTEIDVELKNAREDAEKRTIPPGRR